MADIFVDRENGKSTLGLCQSCQSWRRCLQTYECRWAWVQGKLFEGGGAFGRELCGGICQVIAGDARVAGCPPYLNFRAREEQGGRRFVDVMKQIGQVGVAWAGGGDCGCLVVDA